MSHKKYRCPHCEKITSRIFHHNFCQHCAVHINFDNLVETKEEPAPCGLQNLKPEPTLREVMQELKITQIYLGMRCATCEEIIKTDGAMMVPHATGENHNNRQCYECWEKETK